MEIRRISKTFGFGATVFTALDDVSLAIRRNEFFTLLGPSGCGKTTLLRLIAGFEFPTTGEIRLEGADIAALPPFKRPVNTVFQNYALFPHMTVAENIGFGLKMLDRPKAEIAATVDQMLRLVRMEPMRDRMTSAISGGQQQRVALARALAPRPKVLLLDESLSALDLKLRREMQVELKRLQAETGITFVFVTHDQDEAMAMSDRVAVMSAGRVHQVGTPRDIYDRPQSRFVADFIGETNFFEAEVLAVEGAVAEVLVAGERRARVPWRHGLPPSGKATLVVRPEHLRLAPSGSGTGLPAIVESTVFGGADTKVLLRFAGRPAPLLVRVPNGPGSAAPPEPGAPLEVVMADGAATLLAEAP
ncbi:spermidine/putrescine ABC transporter ATP-binding protein [Aureimonas sp. Leaf460]|nr:spermidine/putrescine ABC transporter ATP-binding protein [Aureimonas sp. Leaf427]KQT81673.1 spermidine/putrescine ABC transporter ATP-binding protein [Aureimonas sp. Leaf460]